MKKARAMYIPAGGKKAVWGPVDQNVLPEGYPYKESLTTVDLSAIYGAPGVVFCKVTDETPEPSASRTKIKVWSNSSDEPNTVGLDNNDENCIMSQSGLVAVAFKDGVVVKPSAEVEITLPKKGVYFLNMAGAVIVTGVAWDSTATQPDITWNGQTETIHPMAPEFLPVVMVEFDAQNSTHNANVSELYAAAKSGKIVMCRGGVEIEADGQPIIEYYCGYFSEYLKNPDVEAAIFVSAGMTARLITLSSDGTVQYV